MRFVTLLFFFLCVRVWWLVVLLVVVGAELSCFLNHPSCISCPVPFFSSINFVTKILPPFQKIIIIILSNLFSSLSFLR